MAKHCCIVQVWDYTCCNVFNFNVCFLKIALCDYSKTTHLCGLNVYNSIILYHNFNNIWQFTGAICIFCTSPELLNVSMNVHSYAWKCVLKISLFAIWLFHCANSENFIIAAPFKITDRLIDNCLPVLVLMLSSIYLAGFFIQRTAKYSACILYWHIRVVSAGQNAEFVLCTWRSKWLIICDYLLSLCVCAAIDCVIGFRMPSTCVCRNNEQQLI